MSYQTSSNGRRRSGFWLVPEKHKFSATNQSNVKHTAQEILQQMSWKF